MRGFCASSGILLLLTTLAGTRAAAAQTPPASPLSPLTFPGTIVPPPTWPYEPLPRRPIRPKHRNEAMMIAGIVLSIAGVALSIAGAGMCANENACPAGLLIVLPLGGTVFPGVGIPLWVNGAKPWRSWDPDPVATSGLSTFTAGWAF
jgi:hypothetical protein